MGRSKNQKIQSDESLILSRLPNELLDMILSYLSSMDLVRAFGSISSDRLQALMHSHLAHFNLTPAHAHEQIKISPWIQSLRLTDRQIKDLIRNRIHFDHLESIDLVQIIDNRVFQLDMLTFAPSIHSLALHFSLDEMSHDSVCCLARVLFNHKTLRLEQVKSLLLDGIHLPFGVGAVQPMAHLRHLRIHLRHEDQLFDLCVNLPRLESLRVDIRAASSILSDRSVSDRDVSPHLKELTLSGFFHSSASLSNVILLYKRTLQRLTLLEIHLSDSVDAHQWREQLVQRLPPLVRFR